MFTSLQIQVITSLHDYEIHDVTYYMSNHVIPSRKSRQVKKMFYHIKR